MKSFAVSICLTIVLASLILLSLEKKYASFYKQVPDWAAIVILAIIFLGYFLALYWGVTGIGRSHRLMNFFGIGVSLFGLALFYYGYKMQAGSGQESPGQFSHKLDSIEPLQKAALDSLLKQTGTRASEITTIAYWEMEKNNGDFLVCLQDSNVIALQIKGKRLTKLALISTFKKLSWLAMDNCGLTSIKDLRLPELERLSIKGIEIASLDGLDALPKLGWIKLTGNPLKDSSALKAHPNKSLYVLD